MSVVDVLNTGLGHLTLRFDPADPIEQARASRAVEDMLRRGYTLFVDVDGTPTRVLAFDAAKVEYIIADVPADWDAAVERAFQAREATRTAAADAHDETEPPPGALPPLARNKRKGPRKRVSAQTHPATAVGRTAGG